MCDSKKISPTRDNTLDVLKALAIWMVILGHTLTKCMNDGICTRLNTFLYLVHIPLFLVISGYLCKDKRIDSGFFKNIAKRFLLPFAVWEFVLTLFYAGFTHLFHDGILNNVQSYLINLRDGMWFIRAFVLTYLLWQVLQFVNPFYRLLDGTAILVTLNACFLSIDYISELFSLSLYTFTIFATAVCVKENIRKVPVWGLVLITLSFVIIFSFFQPDYDYFNSSFSVLWNSGEWHIFLIRMIAGISFATLLLSKKIRLGGGISIHTTDRT